MAALNPRRMELGARPDVLRHRDRPAQFARDLRRLHPVPAQEDLSSHRPFEQGARRPHPRKGGEGFAEGVSSFTMSVDDGATTTVRSLSLWGSELTCNAKRFCWCCNYLCLPRPPAVVAGCM